MGETVSNAIIIAIKQNDLHKWWHLIRPFIEKALETGYGEYEIEDIHTLLEDGNAGLIAVIINDKIVAGIVTTIIDKPAIRELIIVTAGGSHLDEWLDKIMNIFDILAKESQVNIISVHGRAGWVKKLEKYGYDYTYTTVIKRLY